MLDLLTENCTPELGNSAEIDGFDRNGCNPARHGASLPSVGFNAQDILILRPDSSTDAGNGANPIIGVMATRAGVC
jgi:hypothetical protein